jgi:hypothetical protein
MCLLAFYRDRVNAVQNKADASVLVRYTSLFPGITFGAAYKVLQRVYKFGGQPYVRDFLTRHFKSDFDRSFGDKHGKTMIYAVAGSIMGVGEIVLLPLDVLKIKAQVIEHRRIILSVHLEYVIMSLDGFEWVNRQWG